VTKARWFRVGQAVAQELAMTVVGWRPCGAGKVEGSCDERVQLLQAEALVWVVRHWRRSVSGEPGVCAVTCRIV